MKNKLIKTGLLTLVLFLLIINVSACRNIGGAGLWLYDADNEKLNYTTILLNITNFNTGESTLFNNTPAGAKIGAVVFSYSQVFPVHCFTNGDLMRVTANDYPGSEIIFINLSSATTILNLSINISKPIICNYEHNLNYSVGDNISILDDLNITCNPNISGINLSAFKEPFKARSRHDGEYNITIHITAGNGRETDFMINLTIHDPLNCLEFDIDGDQVLNWSELKYFYKHCYLNLPGGNETLCKTVFDFNKNNNTIQDKADMDRIYDCMVIDTGFINHPSTITIISKQTFTEPRETATETPEATKTLTSNQPTPEAEATTIRETAILTEQPQTIKEPLTYPTPEKPPKIKAEQQENITRKLIVITPENTIKPEKEPINITANTKNNTPENFVIKKQGLEINENYFFLILLISICVVVICYLIYSIIKIRYA